MEVNNRMITPEECKRLMNLSHEEIEQCLKDKKSLDLISYLNSNSVKIAEVSISILAKREDFCKIVEAVLEKKLLRNRLAKVCFTNTVQGCGKTEFGIKTSLSFLNDRNADVIGAALWGIVFYNDIKYLDLLIETQKKYPPSTKLYDRFSDAIFALKQGNPYLYSPYYCDEENKWQLDEKLWFAHLPDYMKNLGPFIESTIGDDNFISVIIVENDGIRTMDIATLCKDIESFDWEGYRKYLEDPVNAVYSIGLALNLEKYVPEHLVLKKIDEKLKYATKNTRIKYGILLQAENRSVFLKKTSRQETNFGKEDTILRINKENIHSLKSLAESINTNKTKYFCLFVSTAILHDSAFLSLLDKINKEKVLFWFVE